MGMEPFEFRTIHDTMKEIVFHLREIESILLEIKEDQRKNIEKREEVEKE